MAASANPSGENQEGSSSQNVPSSSTVANGKSSSALGPDNSQTPSVLMHTPIPGISLDWTAEEQSVLEDLLAKHASDSTLIRYAKIAKQLPEKTVRDVALRCRWMNKKENGKRRKDDHNSSRKSKDRKEKGTDSSAKSVSHLSARPNGPPYAPPMIPMDNDDGISCQAIGGVSGELLEQNSQIFNQISANFASFQIHENINLLCRTRDNIFAILNNLDDMPETMKQMPPLPIKVNEDLANSILPRPPPHPMQ